MLRAEGRREERRKIPEILMGQEFQNFSIAALKPKSCADHQNWTRTRGIVSV